MRDKAEMMGELQTMLHDLFKAKAAGAGYPKLLRAHGYVDGYMRALLELGVTTNEEALSLVARERARVSGPATADVRYESVLIDAPASNGSNGEADPATVKTPRAANAA